jgi:hypothetical protein
VGGLLAGQVGLKGRGYLGAVDCWPAVVLDV